MWQAWPSLSLIPQSSGRKDENKIKETKKTASLGVRRDFDFMGSVPQPPFLPTARQPFLGRQHPRPRPAPWWRNSRPSPVSGEQLGRGAVLLPGSTVQTPGRPSLPVSPGVFSGASRARLLLAGPASVASPPPTAFLLSNQPGGGARH